MRRYFKAIGAGFACAAIAGGMILAGAATAARAAEKPSEAQMLESLKPPKTRSLTGDQGARSNENQQFIESVRKTRSLTLSADEREKVAAIAKERPSIDLEIYFNYNSADISSKAVPDLMKLGRVLTNPDLKGSVFLVGGYTDAKGGTEYNQRLSERRAAAVKRFLIEKFDIPYDTLVAAGYGKEHLKNASNPYAAENRRVQIVNLESRQAAER